MENDRCGKQGCPICESGKARLKQCIKTTQGCIIRCTKCRDNNIISLYHGETSCTLYNRLTEHTRGQENKQDDNLLFLNSFIMLKSMIKLFIMESNKNVASNPRGCS